MNSDYLKRIANALEQIAGNTKPIELTAKAKQKTKKERVAEILRGRNILKYDNQDLGLVADLIIKELGE